MNGILAESRKLGDVFIIINRLKLSFCQIFREINKNMEIFRK